MNSRPAFLDKEGQAAHNAMRMHIGLLSDTHIPEAAKTLPPEVLEAFRGVDLILHAGDIYTSSVLDELECIAPVLAASGDDDYRETLADKRVKQKHVLKLEGQTLWLVHEWPYFNVDPLVEIRSSLKQSQDDSPDIVIFGHEHRPVAERYGGILFINPGSPTFLNYRHGLGTVGMLDIDSTEAEVRILQL